MNPYRWSFLLVLGVAAVPSVLSACSSSSSSAAGSAGSLAEAGASSEGGGSGEAGSSPLGEGGSAAGGDTGTPSIGGIGGTFVGGSSGAANGGGGSGGGGGPLCSGLAPTTACTSMTTDGYTTCDETTGSSFANATAKAQIKSGCAILKGTFGTACSTRGLYGRCIIECGQADETITYYYDARAGDAGKSTCEHQGSTWDGP